MPRPTHTGVLNFSPRMLDKTAKKAPVLRRYNRSTVNLRFPNNDPEVVHVYVEGKGWKIHIDQIMGIKRIK